MDRPTPVQPYQHDRPGPSSASTSRKHEMPVPIEEGGIESETDQAPPILEVPVMICAQYIGLKNV